MIGKAALPSGIALRKGTGKPWVKATHGEAECGVMHGTDLKVSLPRNSSVMSRPDVIATDAIHQGG